MPFPGPPAENDPPPPIIIFSTAKGMKSSSFKKTKKNIQVQAYIRMLFRGKKQADITSTHQKRAALQANHDVGELWDWGGTETDI